MPRAVEPPDLRQAALTRKAPKATPNDAPSRAAANDEPPRKAVAKKIPPRRATLDKTPPRATPNDERPRATLGAAAYAELADRLIAGDFAPGEKISLRRLAETLGTSVMPVREAVARLVADEALMVLPNRAVSVPVTTLAAFRQLTEVRVAVEGFAAERAAESREPDDIAAMRRHDAAFRGQCGLAEPDTDVAIRANRDFHFSLYRAARLPPLLKIIAGLWLQVGPILNLDVRFSAARLSMGGAEAYHAACLAAVVAGDGARARASLVGDIENTAAFIASTGWLPDNGEN